MSLLNTLSAIRTASHAVRPATLTDLNKTKALVSLGLVQAGRRSCAGKYFTVANTRPLTDAILDAETNRATKKGPLGTLAFILAAPNSVSITDIVGATGTAASYIRGYLGVMLNAGWIKQNSRKAGYYYSTPAYRDLLQSLIRVYRAGRTIPTPTPVVNVYTESGSVLSSMDKLVLAAIKNAPHAVRPQDVVPPAINREQANLSVGFLTGLGLLKVHSKKAGYFYTNPAKASAISLLIATLTQPTPAPATAPGEVLPTDAVLALCRLSAHGVSMNGIWKAFEKLIAEGLIRADKRDANKQSREVRYFVRKGGPRMGDIRAKADRRIAVLIARNDTLVDEINEFVDRNDTPIG